MENFILLCTNCSSNRVHIELELNLLRQLKEVVLVCEMCGNEEKDKIEKSR